MAVSQSDIDNLNAAIASAERQISHNSKSVTLRSIEDLIKARDDLQRQLNEAQSVRTVRQTRLYQSGRGF